MRKSRCGECKRCIAENCGSCRSCLDMEEFGGKGAMRQACRKRKCLNMGIKSANKVPKKRGRPRRAITTSQAISPGSSTVSISMKVPKRGRPFKNKEPKSKITKLEVISSGSSTVSPSMKAPKRERPFKNKESKSKITTSAVSPSMKVPKRGRLSKNKESLGDISSGSSTVSSSMRVHKRGRPTKKLKTADNDTTLESSDEMDESSQSTERIDIVLEEISDLAAAGKGDQILKELDKQIDSKKKTAQNNSLLSLLSYKAENRDIEPFRVPYPAARATSRWTEDELLLAVKGVRSYGKDFKAIAQVLGTKTEAQVRNFFANYKQKFDLDNIFKEFEESLMHDTKRAPMPMHPSQESHSPMLPSQSLILPSQYPMLPSQSPMLPSQEPQAPMHATKESTDEIVEMVYNLHDIPDEVKIEIDDTGDCPNITPDTARTPIQVTSCDLDVIPANTAQLPGPSNSTGYAGSSSETTGATEHIMGTIAVNTGDINIDNTYGTTLPSPESRPTMVPSEESQAHIHATMESLEHPTVEIEEVYNLQDIQAEVEIGVTAPNITPDPAGNPIQVTSCDVDEIPANTAQSPGPSNSTISAGSSSETTGTDEHIQGRANTPQEICPINDEGRGCIRCIHSEESCQASSTQGSIAVNIEDVTINNNQGTTKLTGVSITGLRNTQEVVSLVTGIKRALQDS